MAVEKAHRCNSTSLGSVEESSLELPGIFTYCVVGQQGTALHQDSPVLLVIPNVIHQGAEILLDSVGES